MLKVTEPYSTGHSTANVCLWRLHGCVLNFIHLSAASVAKIAKSTHLKGCPHTFGYVVVRFQFLVNNSRTLEKLNQV